MTNDGKYHRKIATYIPWLPTSCKKTCIMWIVWGIDNHSLYHCLHIGTPHHRHGHCTFSSKITTSRKAKVNLSAILPLYSSSQTWSITGKPTKVYTYICKDYSLKLHSYFWLKLWLSMYYFRINCMIKFITWSNIIHNTILYSFNRNIGVIKCLYYRIVLLLEPYYSA